MRSCLLTVNDWVFLLDDEGFKALQSAVIIFFSNNFCIFDKGFAS